MVFYSSGLNPTGVHSFHYFRYGLRVHVYINTRTQPKTLISTVVQPVSSLPQGYVLKLFLVGRRVCPSEDVTSN